MCLCVLCVLCVWSLEELGESGGEGRIDINKADINKNNK